jgi:hypothetical protein
MSVRIDEAWREDPAGAIEDLAGSGFATVADRRDPPRRDRDVGRARLAATPVGKQNVPDQDVTSCQCQFLSHTQNKIADNRFKNEFL